MVLGDEKYTAFSQRYTKKISGTVLREGEPVVGCPVYLLLPGMVVIGKAITDNNGDYEFLSLEDRSDYIIVSSDPSASFNAEVFDRVQSGE